MKNTQQKMLANIYDYVKATALPKKQNDDWAKLVRKFEQQSKKELGKWIRNKSVELGNNYIKIGKTFTILLNERK